MVLPSVGRGCRSASRRVEGVIPPVVDPAWLQAHRASVVLADVRWYLDGRSGRAAYDAGHLPGAVFVDLDRWLSRRGEPAEGRHPLPEPEVFAAGMSRLGIADHSVVVAYDDQGGVIAARLVWLLRGTGHDATVLDARPPERYRGDTEPVDPRAGHIPGAVNVPCRDNLDANGRFLPAEALRRRLRAAGVVEGADVVSYCGSGVTACHNLIALELVGLGPGRLYAGSWSGYSSTPGRPVATGDAPG